MRNHGLNPTDDELKDMIRNVDKNSNGAIDFNEFIEMMLRRDSKAVSSHKALVVEAIIYYTGRLSGRFTTLQSMMNTKLSKQRFGHCYKSGLIKTIQTIPHNLYVSVKLTSLYCGLRLILVYPYPQ